MNEAIGFEELRWLREISQVIKHSVPELVGARLVKRGLVERKTNGFTITPRGRIALSRLG